MTPWASALSGVLLCFPLIIFCKVQLASEEQSLWARTPMIEVYLGCRIISKSRGGSSIHLMHCGCWLHHSGSAHPPGLLPVSAIDTVMLTSILSSCRQQQCDWEVRGAPCYLAAHAVCCSLPLESLTCCRRPQCTRSSRLWQCLQSFRR